MMVMIKMIKMMTMIKMMVIKMMLIIKMIVIKMMVIIKMTVIKMMVIIKMMAMIIQNSEALVASVEELMNINRAKRKSTRMSNLR